MAAPKPIRQDPPLAPPHEQKLNDQQRKSTEGGPPSANYSLANQSYQRVSTQGGPPFSDPSAKYSAAKPSYQRVSTQGGPTFSDPSANPPHTKPQRINTAAFYLPPPTTARQPRHLYNQDCGSEYLSIGQIGKFERDLMWRISMSEQFEVLSLLSCMYRNRKNLIHGPNQRSKAEIAAIFSTTLMDFKFSLNELYKRYMMRKAALGKNKAEDFDWWALPVPELQRFKQHLLALGNADYNLFSFGVSDDGKMYLQLARNQVTLNYIQMINGLYDSFQQWLLVSNVEKWWQHCHRGYVDTYHSG